MNSPEALSDTLEEIKDELAKLADAKRSRRTEVVADSKSANKKESAPRRAAKSLGKASEDIYKASPNQEHVVEAAMLFERQDSTSHEHNDTTDETDIYARK